MNVEFLEAQILGCIMKDGSLLDESNLGEHHFTDDNHKLIFNKMHELKRQGKKLSSVMFMTRAYDLVEKVGVQIINDLERKGNPDNFESYETELLDAYKDRETVRVVANWLESNDKDANKLTTDIERIQDEAISDESDIMNILARLHEEPFEPPKGEITGIPSGIKELDDLTSGFQPTDSIILGARPSMGKTAMMLKFMTGAINNGDVPVVFSLEMNTESLLRRLIASVGVINSFQAKNPAMWLSDGKKNDWVETVGKLSSWDYEIYDDSGQTIQYIRSKVRKAKKKYAGRRIVVLIDYMGLIQNGDHFNSNHEKMTDVSRKLKAMAKDYTVPIITLAQLSRGLEQRQDKRPMNSDLRESGSIEEDADMILFLYRESYYDKESEDNTLEIIVSKFRDGATGIVEVDYNRETGVIKNK